MANPALKMQGNASSTWYLFYGKPSSMPVPLAIYFMVNPVLEKQGFASSTCYLHSGKPSSKDTGIYQFYLLFTFQQPSSKDTGKYQFVETGNELYNTAVRLRLILFSKDIGAF